MKDSYRLKILPALFVFGLLLLIFPILCKAKESIQPTAIKVGVYDNPPKIFMNKYGKPEGFFIDILNHIAEKENLKIEYITREWDELLAMLESGEIDVLPDVVLSTKRDSLFSFNIVPLINSWMEIYSTQPGRTNSVFDLNNKKIGVLKNSIEQDYLENNLKPEFNLNFETFVFSNYQDLTNSLKNNDIELLVGDRFLNNSDLCNNKIVPTGVVFRPTSIHFAFHKSSKNNGLVSLFDKHISKLINDPGSEYYKSLENWLEESFPNSISANIHHLIIIFILALIFSLLLLLTTGCWVRTKTLRLRNEALIFCNKQSQESIRLKSAFLQNISHEIRTPMNGIIGFMELLKDPDLNSETRNEYIQLVDLSGKRLMNTVDEIVKISLIESGNIELLLSEVDLEQELQYQKDSFQQKAEAKNIKLKLTQTIGGERALIQTDKTKLGTILSNLLTNAIEYSENGTIEFGNSIEGDKLIFYVKDNGPGIPPDRIQSIFDPFVQVDFNLTRSHQGLGLGLSIAKAEAQALKGHIWVHSEAGKGCTFSFSIPYHPVQEDARLNPEVSQTQFQLDFPY